MSLIKPRTNRVKTVRHICRLQEPNREPAEQALIAACEQLNRPQHPPHSWLLTWEIVRRMF